MKRRFFLTGWALGLMAVAQAQNRVTLDIPPWPAGKGAGVHSPNSALAPLPERADVLPWSLLTKVKMRDVRSGPRPVFSAEQLALPFRLQRVQGFMLPLEAGQTQKHFLLTSVPLTCAFCIPGGPESMVEVFSQTPLKYTQAPLVVEGKFAVLTDDPFGLYYRITHAVSVK
jgi:hypothetical protein